MSRSNFLDRLQQVSPGIMPFMAASLSGSRAAMSGRGGQGKGGTGVGGGGGQPGGGTGGRGKPGGEETTGNRLSYPVIYPDSSTLAGNWETFTFTKEYTDYDDSVYSYFAQKTDGNNWQAGTITNAYDDSNPIPVDGIDIGDALESAPLSFGKNIRIELALYKDIIDYKENYIGESAYIPSINDPDPDLDGDLTAYYMTLIGGQGKTEVQGARMETDPWVSAGSKVFDPLLFKGTVTYQTNLATVDAAGSLKLTIQEITGIDESDPITGLSNLENYGIMWDGVNAVWTTASGSGITIKENLAQDVAFGAETNVAGKLIYGVSGKPWKFSNPGTSSEKATYLLTFSLDDSSMIKFDEGTAIGSWTIPTDNDERPFGEPEFTAFDEGESPRGSFIVPDGELALAGTSHNGLITMLLTVPSPLGD